MRTSVAGAEGLGLLVLDEPTVFLPRTGIDQLGAILRARVPADDIDGNESPDAPRFLS